MELSQVKILAMSSEHTPTTATEAKFYVYVHFRADDGRCFYVGKGTAKRAWKTWGRSQFWKNVANKHGYRVQILATWWSEEDAFEHEKLLIACFRDLGHPLVNLTDGGEGASGAVRSAQTKARMVERARQRTASPEARAALAECARQRWSDPEARAAQAERQRQRMTSPEVRSKVSACMSGESGPNAKLSDDACRQIFRLRAEGLSQRQIAARVGCVQRQVCDILRGKSRRNIYLEFHPEER